MKLFATAPKFNSVKKTDLCHGTKLIKCFIFYCKKSNSKTSNHLQNQYEIGVSEQGGLNKSLVQMASARKDCGTFKIESLIQII